MAVIDGKKIAEELLADLKKTIAGRDLRLAAIIIGDDPALKVFVNLKRKAAHAIGIEFSSYMVETPAQVMETIQWLSKDPAIQGMLVELPIPRGFNTQKILDAIPVEKDVDVLTSKGEEDFYKNESDILPPAVEALKILMKHQKINPKGKNIAVFGQGRLVGKPISHWLSLQGADVHAIDENTENPESISASADIIISGVGKPGVITANMIQEDAVVIDYGFGKKGSKLAGDVDFETVVKKASLITPVPGGMGPIVVAAVLKNLVQLSF